ncbi:MAG: tRNA (guanosine(46)-N7)-methyltransferase TrmB [Alphaproteobacteria bacterium]|nr:MAG: tRNA (guanosine(46)-N7)-methyltransferase TrmB [Alphaproteobacteria bacterium]
MEKTSRTDLKFYGRRKGKAIRPNRQSAYNLVMPWAQIKIDERSATSQATHPSESRDPADPGFRRGGEELKPIDPKSFFDFPVEEVWLEIGFGNGEQLIHQALQNPDIGMIGCEPFMNGVAALCRDIKDKGIKNIRIWQDDARLLMPRFKNHSFARCFLLNLDPWPKKRHHKRRFVQQETLDDLHRLLKKGSELRMSTDDPSLAVWELEKTYFHKGYKWLAESASDWRNRPADMLETRYQKKGATAGRPTVFLRFETV